MPGDRQIPLSDTVRHIAKMYAKGAARHINYLTWIPWIYCKSM